MQWDLNNAHLILISFFYISFFKEFQQRAVFYNENELFLYEMYATIFLTSLIQKKILEIWLG